MYDIIRNEFMSYRPVLNFDLDGTLVDFDSAVSYCKSYEEKECVMNAPGFFENLAPMPYALAAVDWIVQYFEPFILTTVPWECPLAYVEKYAWVNKHLPKIFTKRLQTSHFKNLVVGDFLIDDRAKNGAAQFSGEWIQYGSSEFPNWQTIIDYLARRVHAPSVLLSL